MTENPPNRNRQQFDFADAAHFWEPRRIWYNGILCLFVLLWIVFTWPHFRPALTLVALGKMLILALRANICYCVGYVVELFVQPVVPQAYWRRIRWIVWVIGVVLAIVLENYWIADEIYPDVHPESVALMRGAGGLGGAAMASNMNFPAPLAIVGFLAAVGGLFVAVAAMLILWFARKPRVARGTAVALGVGAVIYFGLLLGFSAASRSNTLPRGQEKYFCEIDCHLAYSIVDVRTQADGAMNDCVITLRTRFDETTASPNRPRDAASTPSPREVRLIDAEGHEYALVSSAGTPMATPLAPAASYTSQLEFKVPQEARGLRLLIGTAPGWPDHFVIGDENSLGHKKTYLAL